MNYTCQVGSRDAACVADRHPVLCEGNSLSRLKERVRLLVAEETCLQLDVRAVIVRKSCAPIEAIRVHTPRPDFLRGHLKILSKMRRARVGVRIPHAHEIFPAPMSKQGHGAIRLISNDAQIFALGFNRPTLHFSKSVRSGKALRVLDPRIIPNLHPGIVPPIKTMANIASVAESDALLQYGGARAQSQL